jgi:alkane 1-monooxygenase
MADLKYLAAYLVPLSCLIGMSLGGIWLWLTPGIVFGVIPFVEIFMPQDDSNDDEQTKQTKLTNVLFDVLLWLNLPIVFGLLAYGFVLFNSQTFETFELIGLVFSLGIVVGSNGINVAHELGHRQDSWERFLGKALLLPSLYMHFYIEHNFGHHQHAATKEDPATARYKESLYAFWVRSITMQYINAWKIQLKILQSHQLSFLSLKNDMFWFSLVQFIYLAIVEQLFGWSAVLFALCIATVGFVLLETINYIEHYGLLRGRKKSGRYEIVRERHSWNSNHALGRILLYELTRHSDHHYRANKKYQVLDYHSESPQLPFGYPTCMVLATVPPLWFALINKRIPPEMIKNANASTMRAA